MRRSRLAYRRRRDRLAAALEQHVPRARISGIAAGLHAIVELPAGQVEHDLVAGARRYGLAVEGLQAYAATPGGENATALVIGYCTPPAHAFRATLEQFCAVLA